MPRDATEAPRIEALVGVGCPNAEETWERMVRVARRLVPSAKPRIVVVRSQERAEDLAFPGSPTVRVEGEDVELDAPTTPALACRTYGGAGAPPEWMIEAAVVRALRPRHLLFLCVANYARSQMAEGLARALAPEAVRISSAGSEPTAVRHEAVEVMAEAGVDLRPHRSKGIDEVEGRVDAVVTLCAEEVCPAWLDDAVRLRWAFSDPAAVDGDASERLEAFRRVRDDLRGRIRHLVAPRRPPAAGRA